LGAVDAGEIGNRLPQLAAGCDPSALELSPAEGFLLSRIDGVTPWRVLREIGGLTPEEVDLCLESWIAQGLLEYTTPAPTATPSAPQIDSARPKAPRCREIDTESLDESLALDVETQRRILEYELKLGDSYHELLGVDRAADAKAVKRAYFELSKEFHPDRYFRKEIGAYEKRLHRIFKGILEAYELLSDPTVRAEVEKSIDAAARSGPSPAPQAPTPGQPPRELTKVERLRARMPFRLPASVLAERQQRAREFWEATQRHMSHNKFIEAASTVRLAIAFDPFNETYRQGFSEAQARAAEVKADALMVEVEDMARGGIRDPRRAKELLGLCEEALLYRPHQPDTNDRAARAALKCDQPSKALEYAERAVEHSPEVASYQVTLAMVHRARGNPGHAIKVLEQALGLEPTNQEAGMLLATLRRA
jgi:tetratricopeptide (TPR) repeat protein